MESAPQNLADLEHRLSEPTPGVVEVFRDLPGDVVVLGAGGKMGPSLTAMAHRASALGGAARKVYAVSRFRSREAAQALAGRGVHVVTADLTDPGVWPSLPDAPLVVFMAGQKFGTSDAPFRTWYTNTVVPAWAASRYRDARMVVFSTGNVYPLVPVPSGGSRETDPPSPIGEYAMSCLGRERVVEDAADRWGMRASIVRLNYAVDLRYGVLVDIARRVLRGQPVDLRMGYVNCIWQGDANAMALHAFGAAAAPPMVFNVTGREVLRVRDVAQAFGRRFDRSVLFVGEEATDALLSNVERASAHLGTPRIDAATLIDWVATWLLDGGAVLDKPTHFEQREGTF